MTAAHLDYLSELLERDEVAAQDLAELEALLENVAAVRARAEHVQRELEHGPSEIECQSREVSDARERVRAAGARIAQAELDIRTAREGDEEHVVRAAEQRLVEARDSLHVAQRAEGEAEAALQARRDQLAAAEADKPQVEADAASLAGSLRERPRLPGHISSAPEGLGGVCTWAIEARAALLVARSGLAAEREQGIRQAGELGAQLTGAPLPAGSMAALAVHIRAALDA